jgi:superfamily II DNA or RNA helicase
MIKLTFEKGTVAIKGRYHIPNTKWDQRTGLYRGMAMHYRDMIDYLKRSKIPYQDNVLDLLPAPNLPFNVRLRRYQHEALERWLLAKRGVIVLPTGAGKTYVAMAAIAKLNCPTFIVVPTLDLVDQWIGEMQGQGQIQIGEYTGREKVLRSVTVSTYDSAYIHADNIGNKFKFIIFDEVHHLPAEGYRHIAEFFASPFRMGLTATYEREDGLHQILPEILGGLVYEVRTDELTGEYLSTYFLKRIDVKLSSQEREVYERYSKKFRDYIKRSDIKMKSPKDFEKVVLRSGFDPMAWEAVKAQNEARKIAYNAASKMEALRELLLKHSRDRIIIFTRYNDLVYRISDEFLIPFITHKTGKEERREVLKGFKRGVYKAIVSSFVLDEGVDVPQANIGIILSGTGSSREFVQRLGRILRPSEREAVLYEIVSHETAEIRTSYRRKRKTKETKDANKRAFSGEET